MISLEVLCIQLPWKPHKQLIYLVMSLFCWKIWTKCFASHTVNYVDSSRNESKWNGFMFRENLNSLAYIQTTTFRAIPAQTEHSYRTCSPLRMRCSGSVDTSDLKHKHRELIIMTFWFLIREQNALWMKPPMFSESFLLCVPLWCDLILSTTSASALLHSGLQSIKGVTSKRNSAGWVWCCAPGTIAPHHRYHKSIMAFHFYWTSTTYACRRCDKGPAQRHKSGLPLNLMLPGLQCRSALRLLLDTFYWTYFSHFLLLLV